MANLLIDVLKLVKVFLTVYVWRVVHLASLPAAISSSLRHLVPNLYALFDIFVLGSTATWSHTARRNTTSAACNVLGPSSRVLTPATSTSADVSLSPLRPNTTLAADRMSPLLSARTRRGSDSTLPSDQEDAAQTGLEADAEDESPALGLRMRHRRAVAAAPQAQLSHEDLLVFAYVPPWLPASVWLPFYRPSRPGSFPFTASSSNSSNSSSRSALQTAAHEDASSSDASSCADGEIRMARRLPPHVQASLHAAAAAVDSSPSVRRPLPCRMPGSKILVLDLDDTLLCTSTTATRYTIPPTYSEAIPTAAGADLYYVWERPHVGLFLQCVSQWYHLVAFTAASQPYADVLLDRLERRAGRAPNKLFRRRLYRGDCTPAPQGGVSRIACGGRPDGSINRGATAPPLQTFWKDLNKVGTPLGRTLLLDDALESFTLQPENGLQCPRYVPPRPTSLLRPASTPMLPVDGSGPSRDKDRALLDLLPILEALAHTWDVRAVLTHQIHLSAAKRGGTQPLA